MEMFTPAGPSKKPSTQSATKSTKPKSKTKSTKTKAKTSPQPAPGDDSSSSPLVATSSPRPPPQQPITFETTISKTLWEDEVTQVYQLELKPIDLGDLNDGEAARAGGVGDGDASGGPSILAVPTIVTRRLDNGMINGTKLLNVANLTRGRRDGILKNERPRSVVRHGAMHLKGVWIDLNRARALAQHHGVYPLMKSLLSETPDRYIGMTGRVTVMGTPAVPNADMLTPTTEVAMMEISENGHDLARGAAGANLQQQQGVDYPGLYGVTHHGAERSSVGGMVGDNYPGRGVHPCGHGHEACCHGHGVSSPHAESFPPLPAQPARSKSFTKKPATQKNENHHSQQNRGGAQPQPQQPQQQQQPSQRPAAPKRRPSQSHSIHSQPAAPYHPIPQSHQQPAKPKKPAQQPQHQAHHQPPQPPPLPPPPTHLPHPKPTPPPTPTPLHPTDALPALPQAFHPGAYFGGRDGDAGEGATYVTPPPSHPNSPPKGSGGVKREGVRIEG
ncbi:hypothetical protein HDV00_004586 [Rhizophlyctis rosea]|nr:hypothetical protein HDV00_004586 [Rhizophlyctis rosea]